MHRQSDLGTVRPGRHDRAATARSLAPAKALVAVPRREAANPVAALFSAGRSHLVSGSSEAALLIHIKLSVLPNSPSSPEDHNPAAVMSVVGAEAPSLPRLGTCRVVDRPAALRRTQQAVDLVLGHSGMHLPKSGVGVGRGIDRVFHQEAAP